MAEIFSQFRRSGSVDTLDSFTSDISVDGNMPRSRKRSREPEDADDNIEVDVASSSLRHAPSKRSRIALAQENGGSVVSDDDDDVLETRERQGMVESFNLRNFDMDDDDNEDDDNNDDDDEDIEIQGTQIIGREMRRYRDNQASESGVIEEVFMRNFMCHVKLRIKLGPLSRYAGFVTCLIFIPLVVVDMLTLISLNFIIGHNGSGKSAILTALTLCLGATARHTNRGKKASEFIKTGEDNASISVKIKNAGDGAFKPDIYGRRIIVERNFTRNGGNTWKVKNEEGKVISGKKGDVDDILDAFGFQFDNPMNVLSQDLAREFLSNSSPADKYKFFIRGTQLEALDRDYAVIEENLDKTNIKIQARHEDVKVVEEHFKRADENKKKLESAARLQEKIDAIVRQHAWAQVEEQEGILEQHKAAVLEAERIVQEKQVLEETVSGTFEGHDQAFTRASDFLQQVDMALGLVKDKHDSLKEKLEQAEAAVKATHHQKIDIREEIKACKKRKVGLEKEISTEKKRIEGAEGAEQAARLEKLEELKAAVAGARDRQDSHVEKKPELQRAKEDAYRKYEAARPAFEKNKEDLTAAERQLRNLQSSQGRPFAGYPANMEEAVRAINSETRWRSKPVGPVGKHIKVLKPEWTSVMERTFGGNLNAFVVENAEDQRMLRSILNRCRCDVPVNIGNAEPMDVTNKLPDDRNLETILSILTIDNDLVRNQLILHNFIEQTVLMADKPSARRFLFEDPNGPPRNVKAALNLEGNTGAGYRQDFSGSGQARGNHIYKWDREIRLQADREQQIQHQRDAVDHYKRVVHECEQQLREKRQAQNKASQDFVGWEREARRLKTACQEVEDAVEAQNNEIESHRPQDGRLQELERQLAETIEELGANASSFGDATIQEDNDKARKDDVDREYSQVQQELEEAQARKEKAAQRLAKCTTDRHNALLEKNDAVSAVTSARERLRKRQEEMAKQQHAVDNEFIKKAEEVCPRIRVPEGVTPEQLDSKLERLEEDMHAREAAAGGTKEQLEEAWQRARLAYESAKEQLSHEESTRKLLTQTLVYRKYRWKMFRKYIAARARITFNYLLSERNFRGRVYMDHSSKKLDISVEPDGTLVTDKGREANTLSGGEKSFSTICLLLSIWEAMGSPIRCLDEFDVFMDSVNRATSMGLMVQAARRSVGRQFIFITPQSMGSVTMGDDVSVHKMQDPERGQTVLPFTPA